jgi:anti-sigma factor RsiW
MTEIDELLAAYADGELDAERTREVERMIAADPALRRTVEIHRETSALLRAACAEGFYADAATPALRPPRRGVLGRRALWPIAASVAAGVFGFGAGAVWRARGGYWGGWMTQMMDEMAEYHGVISREQRHLVEVPASDSEHLKAWLGNRIGRKLVIPDLSGAGASFAGGRLLVVDARPVAELIYTRAEGLPIALCVLRTDPAATHAELRIDRRGALGLAAWSDASHAFVVVGEMDAGALRDLAGRVMAQMTG